MNRLKTWGGAAVLVTRALAKVKVGNTLGTTWTEAMILSLDEGK